MDIKKTLQKNEDLWNIFTLKEEYNAKIHDRYNRFPYYASKNRNVFDPIVSKFLKERGRKIEYPEGRNFAICLTHDIDSVYTSFFLKSFYAFRALQQRSLSECIRHTVQLRSKRFPLWNFEEILEIEAQYGAKSSFYFMAENKSDQDYSYEIEDCESVFGDIIDKGCEIGLHGGHSSYLDPEELKLKKRRLEKILNKDVIGYRNHFLRFRVPDTWENLSKAGFQYDTTVGYSDCVGFRNGMCHPYKPYNLLTGNEIDILEIPLTIMDRTLDLKMNLDPSASWEVTKNLIDIVKENNGVLTLLWHNTHFIGEHKKFYEKMLKYCAQENAWMTSGENIANWWKTSY